MIRSAYTKDLPQINQLYYSLFEFMQNHEPNYMKATQQDQAFLNSVVEQKNNFISFVYERNKSIDGFVIAQLKGSPPYNCFIPQKCVYLMDIIVSHKRRGLGIGKALIKEVEKWGQKHKVDYMELDVLAMNKSAIKLYEREGFTPFSLSMRKRYK